MCEFNRETFNFISPLLAQLETKINVVFVRCNKNRSADNAFSYFRFRTEELRHLGTITLAFIYQ